MALEVEVAVEGLVATRARVGPLLRVDALVAAQVSHHLEGLEADLADERPLRAVHLLVTPERARRSEVFVAGWAVELGRGALRQRLGAAVVLLKVGRSGEVRGTEAAAEVAGGAGVPGNVGAGGEGYVERLLLLEKGGGRKPG